MIHRSLLLRPAGRAAALLTAGLGLLAVKPVTGAAEERLGGPKIELVVALKCAPVDRPSLRDHLTGVVLPRLAGWEREKRFSDHLLLFGLDVNEDLWDALLLLGFDDWTQYTRWKETERTYPAGLSPEGLRLTRSVASSLGERAWKGARSNPPASQPVYFVRPYFFQDKTLYQRFFDAYNEPQFQAWLRAGALNSYRAVLNQNPSGGTWGVLVIYEYSSWEQATGRDSLKGDLGPELNSNPAWFALGEVKGGIRSSGRVVLAERLLTSVKPEGR